MGLSVFSILSHTWNYPIILTKFIEFVWETAHSPSASVKNFDFVSKIYCKSNLGNSNF